MRVGHSKERKTRIDKKKEVKATLSIDLKDAIYRLNYITRNPVKDICEKLCQELIREYKHIDALSKYFQREVRFLDTMFRGHFDNEQISKRFTGNTGTVTVRFKRPDYEAIYILAYALNVSPSRAVAILLEMAMRDINVVNQYVKEYLIKELSQNQMNDLRHVISYTNQSNPNHQPWASFLGHIYDSKGSPMLKMREIINEYLYDK